MTHHNGASRFPLAESHEENQDARLVTRAQMGDSAAFTDLVHRYERKIFGLARHITQSPTDAEEILQDTFLKAFTHLRGFQGNSTFHTWITRIAINESVMRLRRRRTANAVSLDEPIQLGGDQIVREIAVWEDNPEQRYSKTEIRRILDQAIASLPTDYRTVFWLRDVDGLSIEDTAEVLNLSRPAVKSRLMRARLLLREKLTRWFRRKEAGLHDLL